MSRGHDRRIAEIMESLNLRSINVDDFLAANEENAGNEDGDQLSIERASCEALELIDSIHAFVNLLSIEDSNDVVVSLSLCNTIENLEALRALVAVWGHEISSGSESSLNYSDNSNSNLSVHCQSLDASGIFRNQFAQAGNRQFEFDELQRTNVLLSNRIRKLTAVDLTRKNEMLELTAELQKLKRAHEDEINALSKDLEIHRSTVTSQAHLINEIYTSQSQNFNQLQESYLQNHDDIGFSEVKTQEPLSLQKDSRTCPELDAEQEYKHQTSNVIETALDTSEYTRDSQSNMLSKIEDCTDKDYGAISEVEELNHILSEMMEKEKAEKDVLREKLNEIQISYDALLVSYNHASKIELSKMRTDLEKSLQEQDRIQSAFEEQLSVANNAIEGLKSELESAHIELEAERKTVALYKQMVYEAEAESIKDQTFLTTKINELQHSNQSFADVQARLVAVEEARDEEKCLYEGQLKGLECENEELMREIEALRLKAITIGNQYKCRLQTSEVELELFKSRNEEVEDRAKRLEQELSEFKKLAGDYVKEINIRTIENDELKARITQDQKIKMSLEVEIKRLDDEFFDLRSCFEQMIKSQCEVLEVKNALQQIMQDELEIPHARLEPMPCTLTSPSDFMDPLMLGDDFEKYTRYRGPNTNDAPAWYCHSK